MDDNSPDGSLGFCIGVTKAVDQEGGILPVVQILLKRYNRKSIPLIGKIFKAR